MTKGQIQKVEKKHYNKGHWVQAIRCQTCNNVTKLRFLGTRRSEFEDTGLIEVDGKKVQCPNGCNKGWFRDHGYFST